MAFGFGFNKQKALSSAEKFVQQGKLQNAIAEYEKVLKADPKDLTVANRVRDGEIFRVSLQDLFILSDGILQFPLLDKLLRRAESLLLVEPKTKCRSPHSYGIWFRVSLQDLFILSDGILQFPLLDKLLRRAESLLLVEPKTKCHMSADSGSGSPARNSIVREFTGGFPPCDEPEDQSRMVFRTGPL